MKLSAEQLATACGDGSQDAGITIHTILEPIAGPGAPVKPAAYEGGVFQEDWRWWGDPPQETRALVIDNTPSQANRLEASLERLRSELGLPEIVLDLSGLGNLPSHLPRRLSGYRFPHRHADAYLRDSVLAGTDFKRTPQGAALLNATADQPEPLFHWFPQALLFGYWQSHLGKKRTQAKLARSWVSEIVGYSPATGDREPIRVLGLKGDPLNLSVDEPVSFNADDLIEGWQFLEGSTKAGGKTKEKLSEIGHGQVPFQKSKAALGGVSFMAIEQRSTVSFAGLRRVHIEDEAGGSAGRALLVALGLVAQIATFGRAFSLRSGCDLRPVSTRWTWLGANGDETIESPTLEDMVALYRNCVGQAAVSGLMGGGWNAEPLVVQPTEGLAKAIRASWPLED